LLFHIGFVMKLNKRSLNKRGKFKREAEVIPSLGWKNIELKDSVFTVRHYLPYLQWAALQ